MKPTTRILSGLIAVTLGISGSLAWSQAPAANFGGSSERTAVAPSGRPTPEQARAQCDDLLRRARQAMLENDAEAAQRLLSQAEALNVSYAPLHLGDTPAKLRRDLERMAPAQLHGAARPGQAAGVPADPFAAMAASLPPGSSNDPKSVAKQCLLKGRRELEQGNLAAAGYWCQKAAEQKASFGLQEDSPQRLGADIQQKAGRPGMTTALAAGPQPLPAIDGAAALPAAATAPNANYPSTAASATDRVSAGKALLEARRALAVGDVRRAQGILQQMRELKLSFGPQDDTPEKVDAQIRAYSDLMAQKEQRGGTEAFRRQYARLLMEQADGLLRWRELEEAERLATLAESQHVLYNPYEVKPQDLRQRIAAARKPGAGAAPQGAKEQVSELVRASRQALGSHDLRTAEQLVAQAQQLQVPEAAFAPGEDRPSLVLMEIQRARGGAATGMVTGAEYVTPATGPANPDRRADRALYDQQRDPTRNVLAGAESPVTPAMFGPTQMGVPETISPGAPSPAQALVEQGEAALRAQNPEAAMQFFRQAAPYMNELDPLTAQRLQDRLQMLSAGNANGNGAGSNLNQVAAKQQALARQVASEVAVAESNARQKMTKDPKGALASLEETRKKVEEAGLDPTVRTQFLRGVDRNLDEIRSYIKQNEPRIELEQHNKEVVQSVERDQKHTLEIQEKLALMVDEYNTLMREQRFEEAEVLAKRAQEMDPKNPLTNQLVLNSKLIRQHNFAKNNQLEKEGGFLKAMNSAEEAAVPFDDRTPIVFRKDWAQFSDGRRRWMEKNGPKRSERELEIQQQLQTPVSLHFDKAPLSEVLDYLGKVAAVNIHIDNRGLAEEGISYDQPVTIDLRKEIKLESALHLILQPLRLGYVIKDEVLKITSESMRGGECYAVTYNVADLVIPIPNFTTTRNTGMAAALNDALRQSNNLGAAPGFSGGASSPMPVMTAGSKDVTINPAVMAQMSASTPGGMSSSMPMGFGPGGLGGAGAADFDALIELITQTVAPTTWEEVGGTGTIAPFETNLSLVVSQTQEVHEEIKDLLEQLRKLQDLQVTVEVRFITLNDNFFERIGVDFDFDINDNIDRPFQIFGQKSGSTGTDTGTTDSSTSTTSMDANGGVARDVQDRDTKETVTVGMSAPGVFSADLDVPFRQGSFAMAVPQFGGYDPAAGASLGFAILSDIEAFFFIEAATGDRRSNVLQAPKVTLFNGQTANISDMSQTPFVMSVIPVVGDFAAAQQPVVVVLSEGTFLSVQAIISADRRFVRLTVVPFFSQIGAVHTFTFQGSSTTTQSSSQEGVQTTPNDNSKKSNSSTTSSSGTTVQLPTYASLSVTTTVSVPDGGTVLLGGIKRLNEGRSEFGVPFLSTIPYINRLFKNVSIGRETQSLMMMVTPRIIIQEEEEEKLGLTQP